MEMWFRMASVLRILATTVLDWFAVELERAANIPESGVNAHPFARITLVKVNVLYW